MNDFSISKEQFEETRKKHEFVVELTKMLSNVDIRFKLMAKKMDVTRKLQELTNYRDLVDNDKLVEKGIDLLEQFEKILDDFIAENNISTENTIEKYVEENLLKRKGE